MVNVSRLLLIALVFYSTSCLSESLPSYKIGYITDLTGKAAFWGTQSTFGAEMAARELKEKGVDLEIIVEDSSLQTNKAITAANRLISSVRVDAVMSDFTPPSVASSEVVRRGKKLFVYLSPVTSILKSNPYAFKSFLDYREGCKEVAKYWKSKGVSKVAKLKLNAEFGELCLDGAREVYPDLIVVDYNSGEDLRSQLLNLKQKKVEAIFQTAYEVDMLHRLKVMEELDFKVPVGGPEPLITKMVIKLQKQNLNDATVFGYPAISEDFLKNIKELDLNRTDTGIEAAALAYTHVYQIAEVLRECEKGDVDCHVEKMSQKATDSTIGFDGWKNRIAQFDYSLKVWKEGGLKSVIDR